MRTSLFKRSTETVKSASIAQLPQNPDQWPDIIMQTLLSSAPFMSKFPTELQVIKALPEQGMLYALILSKVNDKIISIPVIAENWNLKPLDVCIIDNKAWPLSEKYVIETQNTLGEPAETSEGLSNIGLENFYYSPLQQSTGGMSAEGVGTQESLAKTSSMLEKIAHTITNDDIEQFVNRLAHHNELLTDKDIQTYIYKLAYCYEQQEEDTSYTVIQVYKKGDKFFVKSACAFSYDPIENELLPDEFDFLPPDIKAVVIRDGYYTEPQFPIPPEDLLEEDVYEEPEINSFVSQETLPCGYCKTIDTKTNSALEGIVLPLLTNFFSTPPLRRLLFFNRDGYSTDEKFVGSINNPLNIEDFLKYLERYTPGNTGVFIYRDTTSSGKIIPIAIGPFTIKQTIDGLGNTRFKGITPKGEKVVIIKSAAVNTAIELDDNQIVIPEDSKFLPLPEKEFCLAKKPLVKQASNSQTVTIVSSGTHFTLSGNPIENLDISEKSGVTRAQASYVLGLVGVEPEPILTKAASTGSVSVRVPYEVIPISFFKELVDETMVFEKQASVLVPKPTIDFIKAAVEAPVGETALDNILSLNFLNPTNVQIFLSNIPIYKETLSYLCDLLIASRLGFNIKEISLMTCIKSLEEIIDTLTMIASNGLPVFSDKTESITLPAMETQRPNLEQSNPPPQQQA